MRAAPIRIGYCQYNEGRQWHLRLLVTVVTAKNTASQHVTQYSTKASRPIPARGRYSLASHSRNLDFVSRSSTRVFSWQSGTRKYSRLSILIFHWHSSFYKCFIQIFHRQRYKLTALLNKLYKKGNVRINVTSRRVCSAIAAAGKEYVSHILRVSL
jgi:hypothetical protein